MTDPILTFEQAGLSAGPWYDAGLDPVSFTLHPGELLAVKLEPETPHIPLADLAGGVADPREGRVIFLGRAWADRPPRDADRARAAIGRVLETTNWLSNLDVDENLTLTGRTHTHRSGEDLVAAADTEARRFGLDGIPPGRPALLGAGERARLCWVRALLLQPALLLLERPGREAAATWRAALRDRVADACADGSAAVWLTDDEAEWTALTDKATLLFAMEGSILRRVGRS